MSLWRFAGLFALASLSLVAQGQQINRCVENGKVVFSDQPCKSAQPRAPRPAPSRQLEPGERLPQSEIDEMNRKAREPNRPRAEPPSDSGGGGGSYESHADLERFLREQEERRRASWPPQVREAVEKQQVRLGMTPEQVEASWGKPNRIHSSVSAGGESQTWVYDRGGFRSQYVHLRNGSVTSISD